MLWEHFTGHTLTPTSPIRCPYVNLFDPARYYTAAPGKLHPRWRVRFNGLGELDYCVTVRRIEMIQSILDMDVFGRMDAFIASVGPDILDRALHWAYLSEIDSSFEIERESATQDKAERFVQLLRHAHEKRPLSEEYLTELQNDVISNPFDQAMQYRTEQNWLAARRQRAGVRHLRRRCRTTARPDAGPGRLRQRPTGQCGPADRGKRGVVLVRLHPPVHGRQRPALALPDPSRAVPLGQDGQGFLLPVSVAIKRHEADYLAAPESFSKPVRALWRVRVLGDQQFDCETSAGATPSSLLGCHGVRGIRQAHGAGGAGA